MTILCEYTKVLLNRRRRFMANFYLLPDTSNGRLRKEKKITRDFLVRTHSHRKYGYMYIYMLYANCGWQRLEDLMYTYNIRIFYNAQLLL